MQYALSLIAVVAVIIAAYYVTWFIAARGNGKISGRQIRVRERFALSRDKMLCVAEFNGKLYFIALTNGGVELLEKLDTSELGAAVVTPPPNFLDALKKAWESRKGE